MSERVTYTLVGLFMVGAIVALLVLAFRVSGLTSYSSKDSYVISANFENIGDLKVRAPVTVAGVKIGQVTDIQLDKNSYKAIVTMIINDQNKIPVDSTANILTAGLLGANFIAITPGFEEAFLEPGEQIADTHPAIQLETMIGQLLFNMNKESK